MTDKTHQLIGLTASTAGYFIFFPSNEITWPIALTVIIGSFLGSITPDIDQPTNKLWSSIPLGGLFGRLCGGVLGGHRNLSHSILGTGLFYLLVIWFCKYIPVNWPINPSLFAISAMVGFVFHLLADTITVRGIPYLWPFGGDMGFPPKPFEGIRIITGHWFENLIILPGTTIILIVLIATHYKIF